ncbi:MAG: ATP phosphoribosyltransferase [Candidatus Melainabacteria bacterium]|nr:MAG: ATP phosphoribosyltransferase [Candidatus Melainabacteria bacterium]
MFALQDIPRFVEMNVADVGFTGFDIVSELKSNVDIIMDLDFGRCDMVVAVKEEDDYNCSKDLPQNIKVATSFPNIAKEYFEKLGKKPQIIEVSGATEITPRLGLSDVVVDITSSGATLKSNKLRIIDNILSSSAIIIASKDLCEEKQQKVSSLLRALKSVIDSKVKKFDGTMFPKTR